MPPNNLGGDHKLFTKLSLFGCSKRKNDSEGLGSLLPPLQSIPGSLSPPLIGELQSFGEAGQLGATSGIAGGAQCLHAPIPMGEGFITGLTLPSAPAYVDRCELMCRPAHPRFFANSNHAWHQEPPVVWRHVRKGNAVDLVQMLLSTWPMTCEVFVLQDRKSA